ncbi:MAG: carnitine dehydratase [Magnetovibrio sp.]|nr:carnitine dehydratase [Magnetovibrio sp.]
MQKLEKLDFTISGKTIPPASGEYFESYNPFSGKPWAMVGRGTAEDINHAVQTAKKAFLEGDWPKLTPTERGKLLRKLGDLVAENSERLAKLEVQENGKLIAEMRMQINYLPQWYYYFGGLADKIEGSVLPIDKPEHFAYTLHEPLGVIGMITAWNSPLLLLTWKLAPALAAGNTTVIKPSEFTSASSFEFVKLVHQAGFPPGVVNVVAGFGSEAGEALVTHPDIAKIAFTGGSETGINIYQKAARGLKRVSLELGGKSPNIVFDDCNIENAINGAISAIFAATGQTCIAGSRLLLQRSIHDEFVEKLIKLAKSARMGDPMSNDTQVGPVTTLPQMKKIIEYMEVGKNEGADCLLGGVRATRPECGTGWFVEPTIFTGVNNQMKIAQEEIFGPVLSVIPFDDDDEAVEIANDNAYGLGAGVWTGSVARSINIPRQIRSGTVWVNTYRAVSYMAPFGGYKKSGLGKENGQNAIHEYLQSKTVWVSTGGATQNPFIMR